MPQLNLHEKQLCAIMAISNISDKDVFKHQVRLKTNNTCPRHSWKTWLQITLDQYQMCIQLVIINKKDEPLLKSAICVS